MDVWVSQSGDLEARFTNQRTQRGYQVAASTNPSAPAEIQEEEAVGESRPGNSTAVEPRELVEL